MFTESTESGQKADSKIGGVRCAKSSLDRLEQDQAEYAA